MARLIYSAIMSLDGYVADASGDFQWAAPDDQVHAFVNDLERPVGTYLYGRRMFETMRFWETAHTLPDLSPVAADYTRVWQAATKIVYSTTLDDPGTARTTVRPAFDPDQIRRLKEQAAQDISIGGPTLAAHAIRAGLVDQYQLFLTPILVGGGTRALPEGALKRLELHQVRRFDGGVVYLSYCSERGPQPPAPRAPAAPPPA